MKRKQLREKLLLVLVAFCFITCSANKTNNDLIKGNLKGNIKSISEQSCHFIDSLDDIYKGNVDNNTCFGTSVSIFNEKGYGIEVREYDSRGRLSKNIVLVYDSLDNRIKQEEFDDGKPRYKYEYKYDEKGRLIEDSWYLPNGSLYERTVHKYDKKGNTIEREIYKNDGSLKQKNLYSYNNEGLLVEDKVFDNDGLFHRKTYKYNSNGKIIEDIGYNSKGGINGKKTYKYDDNSNKFEESVYDNLGEFYAKVTYAYDSNGNIIEINEFNSNEELEKKQSYKYEFDEVGNWVKRTLIIKEWTYDYDIDENGDLIREVTSNYLLGEQTKREIEYY